MTQKTCGSVLNWNWISGRFNLSFPYSAWWQHATLWFWRHGRCRCHLPWHCSPCRISSSHAQEGSCVCCMGHHAPAKTQSLWSWTWSWKAYEAQSDHRKILAKPAIIVIILVLVCGWWLTKYHITIVDKCSLLDLNSISLGSLHHQIRIRNRYYTRQILNRIHIQYYNILFRLFLLAYTYIINC